MKFFQSIFLFALITVITTGCYIDIDDDDGFGVGPTVRGSDNVITEGRILDSFSRIEVEGSANVIISQGANQQVEVEADDNIVPVITTKVRGNELEISNSRNYQSNNPVNVYITVPVVSAISVDGSGDVYGQTSLDGDELELDVSGSGDMDLEVFYTRLLVESSGSGDFQIVGKIVEQEIRMSGSGNYDAWELDSEICDIRISGSGDASVFASELLKAEIRGSGNIKYYGNPQVESSVTGSGDIISAP
ncbi:MAG: head GIN domain-containing protein [Tunicatimonas sp.]|uniref:head GIN domain-containing protein n=1 Tax=Tunicatimonas sp. TaxID=1940096 RepID=UPI003C76D85E